MSTAPRSVLLARKKFVGDPAQQVPHVGQIIQVESVCPLPGGLQPALGGPRLVDGTPERKLFAEAHKWFQSLEMPVTVSRAFTRKKLAALVVGKGMIRLVVVPKSSQVCAGRTGEQ